MRSSNAAGAAAKATGPAAVTMAPPSIDKPRRPAAATAAQQHSRRSADIDTLHQTGAVANDGAGRHDEIQMLAAARRLHGPCDRQCRADLGFEVRDYPVSFEHLAGLVVSTGVDVDHEGTDWISGRHTDHGLWESLPPSSNGGFVGGRKLQAASTAFASCGQWTLRGRMARKDRPAATRVFERSGHHGGGRRAPSPPPKKCAGRPITNPTGPISLLTR